MSIITINTDTIAQAVAKQGRVNRNPQHDFYLSCAPYAIQPFAIAPVLPGETMKNALLQARAVSDPLKNPLMGWWSEWYVFYVKLRDLDLRDELTAMLLDPTAPALPEYDNGLGGDSLHKAQDRRTHFTPNGGSDLPNYARLCLDRVVAEYFRSEGDNPAPVDAESLGGTNEGLPPATIQTREFWHDSLKLESSIPAGDEGQLEGEDDWTDANIPPEWANHWTQYQRMRALKLTEVTFADYLKQFGVKAPAETREELHRPELLRYVRDWTYPSNTVDPVSGTPNSVASWSIAERLDKARFFNEPGFIFGVCVHRPKIYMTRQATPAVEMLTDTFSWLPALMQQDPYTSLKRFAANKGPLAMPGDGDNPSEPYWLDVRDLFLYGDQFFNGEGSGDLGDFNNIPLPATNLQRRYATDAQIKTFFKDAAKWRIRCDGVLQLTIAGNQKDHT